MEKSQKNFFGDYGTNKNAFHKHKQQIDINKIDIEIIAVPNKDPYGNKGSFKYFIGYKSIEGIRPLCIYDHRVAHC